MGVISELRTDARGAASSADGGADGADANQPTPSPPSLLSMDYSTELWANFDPEVVQTGLSAVALVIALLGTGSRD